ncbi:hypothetical protein C1Y40_04534 [Mycobacterium talmoniae]|uniref:Uncharacterized protein n=1 Tax=Mycobacterium talmoniae TaxID=1858794 RepID=A0A2S8BFA2_9MYCO|nr:hypothetical protein [Mycobacterium eburneum]PQM45309.1 hypothetical protein C1Y40_04534 [Mycobacterium talmoniae]TDH48471.1 hypothetical protein E2F47_23685 [Mycobacterium eburneum]
MAPLMDYGYPVTLMYALERASWIRNHARSRTFQRTRADLLQLAYDDHRRAAAGVAYNPHAQGVTEFMWLRSINSRAGAAEAILVVGCALLFPLAWPLGRLLYRWLARRITPEPESLHSIPITALAWIGAAVMTLGTVIINPSGATFGGTVILPWILVQGAGTFLMASVYGILEGWLAIPGSTDLWPYPPPPLPETPSFTKQQQDRSSAAATPPGQQSPPPMRAPRDEPKPPWEH